MSQQNEKRTAAMAAAGMLLTCVVGIATVAYTQTLPRTEAEFDKMIGITPAQKAKVTAINTKYKPQVEAINKKYVPKFQALQKQLQALQVQRGNELKPVAEKANKEIEAVLTPAQRTKIKQIQTQAQQMQMMQGGGGGAPGMGAGAPR